MVGGGDDTHRLFVVNGLEVSWGLALRCLVALGDGVPVDDDGWDMPSLGGGRGTYHFGGEGSQGLAEGRIRGEGI